VGLTKKIEEPLVNEGLDPFTIKEGEYILGSGVELRPGVYNGIL
jgi:hypothetical protein